MSDSGLKGVWYVDTRTDAAGLARFVAWATGVGSCLSLYIKAGKVFQKSIL